MLRCVCLGEQGSRFKYLGDSAPSAVFVVVQGGSGFNHVAVMILEAYSHRAW